MAKKRKFEAVENYHAGRGRPGLTAAEVGEIFWQAAHTLDEEVLWVRLGADLDAEIRLGGSELLVLEMQDHDYCTRGYVCLARIEEELESGWTVELLHSATVDAERLAVLSKHAQDRTAQPVVDCLLMSGNPRQGARLVIEKAIPIHMVTEVLL
jgi:hypothetical protein